MGHFQPNLAQIIFGWREFTFVEMKGPAFYQGEKITNLRKYIEEFKKPSPPEPLGQFQPNLAQIQPLVKGIQGFWNEGLLLFQKGDN